MSITTKVRFNYSKARANLQAASKEALFEAAEFILQESNKIAPLDEGTLIRSGNVDSGEKNGKPAASVYYDTPYAVRLHEHPEYNFQNGREGKYLEKTLTRNRAKVKDYIESRMKDTL